MDPVLESSSEQVLTIFVGTLLSLLVAMVMSGRANELRAGVRSLFSSDDETIKEPYRSPRLSDYETL
jgi:uncharacterized membrane protein YgaE (UPF0421/DUF939 family)